MSNTETYNSSIGEIIEPESLVYSFQTLGWQIVFVLFILILVIIALWQYRIYQKNAYRRNAIAQINAIANKNTPTLFFEVNMILKSVALSLYDRTKVAKLYGSEWFQFLDSTLKNKQPNYNNYKAFTEAIYNKQYVSSPENNQSFIAFASNWIKKHKV